MQLSSLDGEVIPHEFSRNTNNAAQVGAAAYHEVGPVIGEIRSCSEGKANPTADIEVKRRSFVGYLL
jgi:hypothetical protein